MKKKILFLILICFLFSFVCGCTREIPEYLPGENVGDSQFVWVCHEPFGFFFAPDDNEGYYGFLKGYLEKEGELVCLYSDFTPCDQRTNFQEEKLWGDPSTYESFWGYADYCEDYFDVEIDGDLINFFDGELPTMRFDKMAREDFIEQYGDIENISELLSSETSDVDDTGSIAK